MRMTRLFAVLGLALGLLAISASGAAAKSRDRNHDRIPDRWEHKNHLSLKVKQAKRDQDRDGLNNLGEFRADTDPHNADTDDDGVDDGDEHAGTIASFDSQTGVLAINLFGGGTVSGKVTDETDISCDSQDDEADDDTGDTQSLEGDDQEGSVDQGDTDTEPGDDDNADDEDSGDDEGEDCSTADLKPGTVVDEADLEISGAGAVFEDLELVT